MNGSPICRTEGFIVSVKVEPSGKEPHPHEVDYNSTKELLAKSASKFRRDNPELLEEVRRNARHLDIRIGTRIFTKCSDATCEHCSSNPQRCSHELMNILHDFPTPTPSQTHDSHFCTFQESLSVSRHPPCEHLPLFQEKGLGHCSEDQCKYVFTSRSDAIDHKRKIHSI